ncbi:MAG TPA: ATP-dependent metallopeptidase FtsH/Yme1/Tma family protein, partial [Beijerinckiaceae bacterium]|nr:ATP-dependent metallopeptidase FtsH/Yme1/Tma family protein [Beijerinckiaceae bacterium]
MNSNFRNFGIWIVILLLVFALFTVLQGQGGRSVGADTPYSRFLDDLDAGKIARVTIARDEITGMTTDGRNFQTRAPFDPKLVERLHEKKIEFNVVPPNTDSPWYYQLLFNWLPLIVFLGAWIFMSRQMQNGAGRAMGFGKSKAKLLTEAHGRVTFDDVAGIDEAKEDLQEIVEFLRDPQKFQ